MARFYVKQLLFYRFLFDFFEKNLIFLAIKFFKIKTCTFQKLWGLKNLITSQRDRGLCPKWFLLNIIGQGQVQKVEKVQKIDFFEIPRFFIFFNFKNRFFRLTRIMFFVFKKFQLKRTYSVTDFTSRLVPLELYQTPPRPPRPSYRFNRQDYSIIPKWSYHYDPKYRLNPMRNYPSYSQVRRPAVFSFKNSNFSILKIFSIFFSLMTTCRTDTTTSHRSITASDPIEATGQAATIPILFKGQSSIGQGPSSSPLQTSKIIWVD